MVEFKRAGISVTLDILMESVTARCTDWFQILKSAAWLIRFKPCLQLRARRLPYQKLSVRPLKLIDISAVVKNVILVVKIQTSGKQLKTPKKRTTDVVLVALYATDNGQKQPRFTHWICVGY